ALLAEPPAEQDAAIARDLAGVGAEALAAALVRVLRAPLPAPEELSEMAPARPTQRDAPEAPREGGSEGVWFRVDVGRAGNADPRWLLPFLCRRGHVTRAEIGRIRIMARETQVEVAPYAAARFAAAARRTEGEEDAIRIAAMQPLPRDHQPPGEEPRRRPVRPPEGNRAGRPRTPRR
ncbi:DbpA RNA binding domain-containing protein, partial [Neoroseomonas rubea]|uniref:DbpA RNA binding domain-containing protein n=1 Tax=Neoroseomonas rubea TaxID=2748666 RepID=UPI0018DFBEFD